MKKSSLKHYVMLLETELGAVDRDRNYWMGQYDLKVAALIDANDEIKELRAKLGDNDELCALRAKLSGTTCEEANASLREKNSELAEEVNGLRKALQKERLEFASQLVFENRLLKDPQNNN